MLEVARDTTTIDSTTPRVCVLSACSYPSKFMLLLTIRPCDTLHYYVHTAERKGSYSGSATSSLQQLLLQSQSHSQQSLLQQQQQQPSRPTSLRLAMAMLEPELSLMDSKAPAIIIPGPTRVSSIALCSVLVMLAVPLGYMLVALSSHSVQGFAVCCSTSSALHICTPCITPAVLSKLSIVQAWFLSISE